jgi:DNA-binding PadR family transcriptional regulator
VLERSQYSDRPPRHEYRLTPAGRELLPVLLSLGDWGDRHLYSDEPPVTYEHTCGETFQPLMTCAACGEPVRHARELRIIQEHPQHVGV